MLQLHSYIFPFAKGWGKFNVIPRALRFDLCLALSKMEHSQEKFEIRRESGLWVEYATYPQETK